MVLFSSRATKIELLWQHDPPQDLPMTAIAATLSLTATVRPVRLQQQAGRLWRPIHART
jgi:hypothetical protein